ncbi:iron-containing redox enzyme family protein [Methylicorpusculum oleiharenae]|uniref:iron-containing redox enzyme family protein n=1 Tax=Methylicorpusculum oleiharenae TaxID=1338687 RepID=UPI001358B75D|nr:iron-containing redox enzyme family protein [Methylicorpusculum oleiharenae]MCD2450340.1 iron-containing redox enzyme family protein [Methylicorpusculum oleiharenae]
MTVTTEHPFYPLPNDTWLERDKAGESDINSRDLFHALITIGSHYDWLPDSKCFLVTQLRRVEKQYESYLMPWKGADNLTEWTAGQAPGIASAQMTPILDTACFKLALMHAAPVMLTEPCWLKSISQVASCQTELAAGLTHIYLSLQGTGSAEQPFEKLYQSLLLNQSVNLSAIYSRSFSQNPEIPVEAFSLASLQLAFSYFPRTFLPEILGFSLAYCQRITGMEEQVAAFSAEQGSYYFSYRRNRLQMQVTPLLNCISGYLDLLTGHDEQQMQVWRRIQCGYYLSIDSAEKLSKVSQLQRLANGSVQDALRVLLSRKANAAQGHHGRIQLGGKPLDHWFAESPFDADGFLNAVKASRYYNSDDPGRSELLKLFSFEGPMFGVMTADETAILKAWLMDKPLDVVPVSQELPAAENRKFSKQTLNVSGSLTNRELFYRLVNIEQYPDSLPIAKQKARQLVISAGRWHKPILNAYSQAAFDSWFESFYRQEMSAYRPLTQKPRLSREAYVFGIEQFAPAILTDGCWLQQSGQLDFLPFKSIGEKLQLIFYDEIGAGIRHQNHPYIYDRLLKSLDIQLPPVQSKAFSKHPGFIDSAFDLPVFMMSLGFFPAEFLPELLGLNLAIELSGLGKTYLRLADELQFWGIDPAIIKLHVTIDNTDTGHAAIAKEAIHAYLDDIGAGSDQRTQQKHWRRISAGYASLNTVTRWFKWALVIRYLSMKLPRQPFSIPSLSR